MNHGTIRVSARKMASVLIGGNVWLVMPKAVAAGRVRVDRGGRVGARPVRLPVHRNSTDGLPVPFDHRRRPR